MSLVAGAWRLWLVLPLGGLLAGMAAAAPDEHALKAAIVSNLLQFVQWPAEWEAMPAGSALGVCADRAMPMWPHLKALQDRPVRQWQMTLREPPVNQAELGRQCQVWIVEGARAGRPAGALPARTAAGRAVLTLGDGERADEDGVIVSLAMADGRVAFDVDQAAARANQLRISSKVLRLARAVHE